MTPSEPERTCLICRRKRSKPALLRIVRSPGGRVSVDAPGEAPGRGTYVCRDDQGCLGAVTERRALSRALRMTLAGVDLARLATEIEKESVEA